MRNRHAIMGGWNNKQVTAYVRIHEITAKVDPVSFRCLRADCWDLPLETRSQRVVELTDEQRAVYDTFRRDMRAELGDHVVSATIVLTKMLRMQQIVGGYITSETTGAVLALDNAKLTALLELIEEDPDQSYLVWCAFRAEIEGVRAALSEAYGAEAVVEMHGGVSVNDREVARSRFQNQEARFFIGQPATGAMGLDLSAADVVVYYSNTFRYEDRSQSEDRVHHRDRKNPITYVDLIAERTVDEHVLRALRSKQNFADLITGDNLKEWLT
jgi:SNF2 family DNA or RNA helicase